MSTRRPLPPASSRRNPSRSPAWPPGNTALCTVGRSGNDLHYRGYDILDIADNCEFEEVAYLLVHGKLPNQAELDGYKAKLRRLRGLPVPVRAALEALPAASHPMDVMRTGASVLGCTLPEKDDHNVAGARDIADRLIASFGSMLVYWYHYSHSGVRIAVETEDDTVGGHFLHLLHRRQPPASWVKAMHVSLILYAEHEFNASTFAGARDRGHRLGPVFLHHRRDRRAARPEARRRERSGVRGAEALRRPGRRRGRHPQARRGEGSDHRLRPPGLHDRRSAQQGDQGSGAQPVEAKPAT